MQTKFPFYMIPFMLFSYFLLAQQGFAFPSSRFLGHERFLAGPVNPVDDAHINTYLPGSQDEAAVAMLKNGKSVVTWQSNGQDGSASGIYARMYDSNTAIGDEFLVNTYTTSDQKVPGVAALTTGGFVITWYSNVQDGSSFGVFAQRFKEDGTKEGDEFQVNTNTLKDQQYPVVAGVSGGGFVIAWQSLDQDGSSYGIYAQRFKADGTKDGDEFGVNTFTTGAQSYPTIAALNDGAFVIAWHSLQDPDNSLGVYAQLYKADGSTNGEEFRVNTYTAGSQSYAAVAPFLDGRFMIAWASGNNQDGSGDGVFAQMYNGDGTKIGIEFQVNTYTSSGQQYPAVASLFDGGFVVAWQSQNQDGLLLGIFAQAFSVSGAKSGPELQVNTETWLDQMKPCVIGLKNGFAVVWHSGAEKGGEQGYGIYGKWFICPESEPLFSDNNCYDSCLAQSPLKFEKSCVEECPTSAPIIINNECLEDCPALTPFFYNNECLAACPNAAQNVYNNKCYSTCPSSAPILYNKKCLAACPAEAPLKVGNNCYSTCPSSAPNLYNNNCYDTCPASVPKAYNNGCIAGCPAEAPLEVNNNCYDTCPSSAPNLYNDNCYDTCPSGAPKAYNGECLAECPSEATLEVNNNCYETCPETAPILYNSNCYETCPSEAPNSYESECYTTCPDEAPVAKDNKCTVEETVTEPPKEAVVINKENKATDVTMKVFSVLSSSNPSYVFLSNSDAMILYIRYLNVNYPEKVIRMFQERGKDMIAAGLGIGVPQKVENSLTRLLVLDLFKVYDVKSSFLYHLWDPVLSFLILIVATAFIMILEYLTRSTPKIHFVFKTLLYIAKWNLPLIVICGNFNNIMFYSILEFKEANLETSMKNLSFAASIITLILVALTIFMTIRIARNIRQSKENPKLKKEWNDFAILYQPFKDDSYLTLGFFPIFFTRILLFNIILTASFSSAVPQTIIIAVISFLFVVYLLWKRPLKSKLLMTQVIFNETILLILNIAVVILAAYDHQNKEALSERDTLGELIIVMNILFSTSNLVFIGVIVLLVLITLYKKSKTAKSNGCTSCSEIIVFVLTPQSDKPQAVSPSSPIFKKEPHVTHIADTSRSKLFARSPTVEQSPGFPKGSLDSSADISLTKGSPELRARQSSQVHPMDLNSSPKTLLGGSGIVIHDMKERNLRQGRQKRSTPPEARNGRNGATRASADLEEENLTPEGSPVAKPTVSKQHIANMYGTRAKRTLRGPVNL